MQGQKISRKERKLRQKAMEQSGDVEDARVWRTPDIARQDLLDSWSEDAGAWDLEDIDPETRDQLWDMVVEAYFGPSTGPDLRTETESA